MVPLAKFSVAEVAEHFGVSERYLSATAKAKKLCGKAGRSLYFIQNVVGLRDDRWKANPREHGAH
jgi:hypothetical protein